MIHLKWFTPTGAPFQGPFVEFLVFLEELGPSVVQKSGWVMVNIPIYHQYLTVKHGGGVMWGVALLLWDIYSKLKAHRTSTTTTAATSHLVDVKLDQQFIFNRTKTPNTPPGCVKAIWPRKGIGVLRDLTQTG